MKHGRVLVVDDSEDDHLQIGRLLRAEAEVFRAYSASEAMDRLEREDFDVLISDQKMPRMSGDELIRQVKNNERSKGLRCILLSGRTSNDQLVEILRSGHVFRYFEKNRTLLTAEGKTELIIAVRNGIQASRLEREAHELRASLQSQVDALGSQYRLMRSLLAQKDPASMLAQVVSSLVDRVRCRFVLGFVDLLPSQGLHGVVAIAPGNRQLGSATLARWQAFALQTFTRLSGRPAGDVSFQVDPARLVEGEHGPEPTADSPALAVFVNRDLRGLIVVGHAEALSPDEARLIAVWRDQLQDALTRVHTSVLDAQHRVELMVETMTEGVMLTDERGVVTLMNPVARRLLKLPDSTLPDFTTVLGAMGLSSLDVLRRISAGRSTAEWFEKTVEQSTWQVLFAPVRDHASRFVGILTVIRDVTTEKIATSRREEFLHIITHELRGPLTSISGVLDLLERHILGEMNLRQTEYVGLAKSACTKINKLLDDLLDLAKFEQGKMPLAVAPVHLERVIAGVVDGLRPAAWERGVKLYFDCMVEGLICHADATRVGQVVVNLLTNALKFTPKNEQITVSVFTTFAAPDLYLVAVHNPGEEIPERDLERIFNKFEQVGERRGGTGLGLAVCRNIVEGHGGRIWVESGRGEGTTFVFSLPEEAIEVENRPPVRAEEREVLVVGRDRAESRALAALLAGQGHHPTICDATPEAIQAQLARQAPAIAVFIDVEGVLEPAVFAELARERNLPVLAVLPPGIRTGVAVDGLMEVPPDPSLLTRMLRVIVARKRRRRRLRVLVISPEKRYVETLVDPLEEAGYLAYTAFTSALGEQRITNLLPDLVLLDPTLSQIETLRQLCEEQEVPRLEWAEPEEPADAASSGEILLDDADLPCVVEPEPETAIERWPERRRRRAREGDAVLTLLPRFVETPALIEAVRAQLFPEHRAGVHTLVVLPGAREMQREVTARIRERQPFAYCAVDIVGLKAGVESAGFMWGHQAMAHTAEVLHDVLTDYADARAFLGHERDDDFVFLVGPEHIESVCAEIVRAFTALGPLISADTAVRLRLSITAIVNQDHRYDRFSALRAALGRARTRENREVVCIERVPA